MTLFGFRYPAVIILGCAVAGTLLGRAVSSGLPVLAAVMIMAALALAYAFMRLPAKFYIIPLAIFVIAGSAINAGLKYHIYSTNDIGQYVGGEERIRFFAEVDKWPVIKRHKTVLTCRVDSISLSGTIRSTRGLIHLVIRQETTAFAFGDEISFEGRLRRPLPEIFPGQFDYARYLYGQGVRGTVTAPTAAQVMIHADQRNLFGRAVGAVRGWILACFQSNLTETPAALASGFLIGETRDIPDPIYKAFRRTGTMHLLAVSGSNVALVLVAAIFVLRFMRIRNNLRAVILFASIIIFSHLSYNQPSVVRASIMAALIIGARVVYRRIDLNNIIASAAVILTLFDPANLFDVGFQLSFAVTWGLILFLPYMNGLCERYDFSKSLRYVSLIIFSSVIATLISAPITAYYFGEISLVTVASNLIVVPLVSAAVLGSLILLGVNLLLPQVAIVAGMFLDRLLKLILAVVVWFGQWEFAEAKLSTFSPALVFLYLSAAVLLFLCIRYRMARIALAGIGVVAAVIIFAGDTLAMRSPSPEVEIFNTGASHAVIINHTDGLVIFRQLHDDSYDEFSSELLPYLVRRPQGAPRYFVFLEPRYRTERHLEKAAESGSNIGFRPFRDSIMSDAITILLAGGGPLDDPPGSPPTIAYTGGILAVQFSNSYRLVFADGMTSYLNEIGHDGEEAGYYIVAVKDIDESVSNVPAVWAPKTILLVPESTSKHGTNSHPESFPVIVGENSRLILPQRSETGDCKRHFSFQDIG